MPAEVLGYTSDYVAMLQDITESLLNSGGGGGENGSSLQQLLPPEQSDYVMANLDELYDLLDELESQLENDTAARDNMTSQAASGEQTRGIEAKEGTPSSSHQDADAFGFNDEEMSLYDLLNSVDPIDERSNPTEYNPHHRWNEFWKDRRQDTLEVIDQQPRDLGQSYDYPQFHDIDQSQDYYQSHDTDQSHDYQQSQHNDQSQDHQQSRDTDQSQDYPISQDFNQPKDYPQLRGIDQPQDYPQSHDPTAHHINWQLQPPMTRNEVNQASNIEPKESDMTEFKVLHHPQGNIAEQLPSPPHDGFDLQKSEKSNSGQPGPDGVPVVEHSREQNAQQESYGPYPDIFKQNTFNIADYTGNYSHR